MGRGTAPSFSADQAGLKLVRNQEQWRKTSKKHGGVAERRHYAQGSISCAAFDPTKTVLQFCRQGGDSTATRGDSTLKWH